VRAQTQDARNSPSTSGPVDDWETVRNAKGKKNVKPTKVVATPKISISAANTNSGSISGNANKYLALNSPKGEKSGKDSNGRSGGKHSGGASSPKKGSQKSRDLKVDVNEKEQAGEDTQAVEEEVEVNPNLEGSDGNLDPATLKRICASFKEYYATKIVEEVVIFLKEVIHPNSVWRAIPCTLREVTSHDAATRDQYSDLLFKLYEQHVVTRDQVVQGLSAFLDEFDDLVVDVPLLSGYFSRILAQLFVSGILEGQVRFITTLPEENNFTLSLGIMNLVVRTAVDVKNISNEERAIAFFQSAADVASLDGNLKEQLDAALSKFEVSFLPITV